MQNTADDFISTDCLDLTHLFKFFKHMAWICQQMSILCVDGGGGGGWREYATFSPVDGHR